MKNIYLFYGEDKYELNMKVEKLKKQYENLEIGVNLFTITKENIDEIYNVFSGVTFFGSSKLIIIKDTKLKFDVDYVLKNIDEDITVIIIEDMVDKRIAEYKKIIKEATAMEFKNMDSKQMTAYIIKTLKKYNVDISQLDAGYMESICGDDKSNIINELQKLVLYVGKGSVVTREIIDKVCSKNLNAKIFDVLNMIINKNKKAGIGKLDELLKQKEPIIKIAIMLYRQIKQLYYIKYLKEKKVADIANILKINPYVYGNLKDIVNKYTLGELKNILYEFDEYDRKTKIGELDFEIGLKKLILAM